MNIESEPGNQPKYKTLDEAATAIANLSSEEHVKLRQVASIYWSGRKLNDRWGSPDELLSEAIVRTLRAEGKRWRSSVEIVLHLKKAMKNISGHLARKQKRLTENGIVEPHEDMPQQMQLPREVSAIGAKEILTKLQHHFGPDQEAFEFLICRSKGMTESESATHMGIENSRIEAIGRRCRRKVASFKERSNL